MAESKITIERLRSGAKIVCPQCEKDVIAPVSTTADKAHWFVCPKCDFEIHWTPAIDID